MSKIYNGNTWLKHQILFILVTTECLPVNTTRRALGKQPPSPKSLPVLYKERHRVKCANYTGCAHRPRKRSGQPGARPAGGDGPSGSAGWVCPPAVLNEASLGQRDISSLLWDINTSPRWLHPRQRGLSGLGGTPEVRGTGPLSLPSGRPHPAAHAQSVPRP